MSAGVCGKRLGLEEIFGSPSPAAPSAKRSRFLRYGSPMIPPNFGFVAEDKLSFLLQMFPSVDQEVVESILNSHNQNIDDTIKRLRAHCLGDDPPTNESVSLNSVFPSNHNAAEGGMNHQASEHKAEETRDNSLNLDPRMAEAGSSWVDLFIQETMNALNWDDVRGRTTKFLEVFERSVLGQATTFEEQQENTSLKELVQCLLRDNQTLKRAVAIQHERYSQNEDKVEEVQQLKFMISQYREHVRTLEMTNYTLKIHLQRAQESKSIASRCHPDIF